MTLAICAMRKPTKKLALSVKESMNRESVSILSVDVAVNITLHKDFGLTGRPGKGL
jgi:hypothetical protein